MIHLNFFPLVGLASLLSAGTVLAQLPPRRSTAYAATFSSALVHPTRVYAPNARMTVEAWVYREDANRCETVVSQDFTQSFWLGFCGGSLRFYRSGRMFANAGVNVPAHRWTHVAASYGLLKEGGGEVRFYIDGVPVATGLLDSAGGGHDLPVTVGSDIGLGGFRFLGALDEVRIWSEIRTEQEIRDHRFEELVSGPGLEAAFPDGGGFEAVSGQMATLPTGVAPQVAGILPRDLVVPRTARLIVADGNPSTAEFEGAEELVVRYLDDGKEIDGVARLILRQEGSTSQTNLWIGLAFPELVGVFGLQGGSVRTYFDPDSSGDSSPSFTDLRLGYSAYAASPTTYAGTGTGLGGFGTTAGLAGTLGYVASQAFCRDEFAPPCVEMKVPLPSITAEPDTVGIGFMLDFHRPASGGVGGLPTLVLPAPFNAVGEKPNSWPNLSFGEFVGVPIASVTLNALVWEVRPDGSRAALNGVEVLLRHGSSPGVLATADSGSAGAGRARFALTLAQNTPLRLEVVTPGPGWEHLGVEVSGGGVPPTSTGTLYASYPGCPGSECTYQLANFLLRRPVGAVSFTGVAEPLYFPRIVLRDAPGPRALPPSTVTLEGVNLHERMSVWVSDGQTIVVPSGSMLEPPAPPTLSRVHYWLAPIESVAADGSSLTVLMDVPSTLGPAQFWVRDNWDRPERDRYWHAAGAVQRGEPAYELIHGFSFENFGDGHDIDDYRAAFPGLVCDPFKMVGFWAWFPIYLLVLDGGGECVGMCSTSEQFSRWRHTEPYDPVVYYANGFRGIDLMPARFDTGNPCSPRPSNVWGLIRANHGAQLSAEFIGECLAQLQFTPGPPHTVMADVYNRVRGNPRGKVLCFRQSTFSTGHCVLALATRDAGTNLDGTPNPDVRDVIVYDPNDPNTTRVLHLNVATDRFFYDGFDPVWRGPIVVVHEVRNFWEERPRNLITVDSLGAAIDRMGARGVAELIAMLVSGDARPMITAGPGEELGLKEDGTLVETLPTAVSLPHWGYLPGTKPPPAQYFMKVPETAPRLDIHAEGENYAMNVMHQGTMFQLFVQDAAPGETDVVNFGIADGLLRSFRFQPQQTREQVTPILVLAQGGSNYLAGFLWEGLEVPAGGSATFGVLPDTGGVEFLNDTGSGGSPTLQITRPSAEGVRTNIYGPLSVPQGATQVLELDPDGSDTLRTGLDFDRDGVLDEVVFIAAGTGGISPQPRLAVSIEGGLLRLAWPVQSEGWLLEQTSALDAQQGWQTVSGALELEGGDSVVRLSAAEGVVFLRLRRAL